MGAPVRSIDAAPQDEASLRAAYVLARQRAAGPEYAVRVSDGMLHADNIVHGFAMTFQREGLVLHERREPGETSGWEASVVVDAFGCPESLTPLGSGEPQAALPNRVEQAHDAITAWYLNGPLGLEQGFEVPSPPECLVEESMLSIVMTVAGLTPRLTARGEVALAEASGSTVLRYGGLHVVDADGVTLPAALRVVGDRLFIDFEGRGAAFPVTIDPLWAEQVKLTPSVGDQGSSFGYAVSLSGDTAVIGALADAPYVFVRSGTIWTQQAQLTPSDAGSSEWSGVAVSLAGDTAVVGAPSSDTSAGPNAGAAYVFVRNGSIWTEQAKLTASDATSQDSFGSAVSLDGDTALVGAILDDDAGNQSGSAYVFVRNGTAWSEQAKLVGSDSGTDDNFGVSVSLSGETALIGSRTDTGTGSAYVFQRSGASWAEQARLTASDGLIYDYFGNSVSLSGDTALIGAGADDASGFVNSGSAYVFVRSGTTWTEEAKLLASDASDQDAFGNAVSLSGDKALVGAPYSDGGGLPVGAVYLFVRAGTSWVQHDRMIASDAVPGDSIGNSVSLSGDTALAGDAFNNVFASNSGAAYVFIPEVDPCTLDSQCTTGFCRDGVCCADHCGGGDPDDCIACSVAAGSSALADGVCSGRLPGSACSDGNSCSQDDVCQASTCVGGEPVICEALDACHDVGQCSPADGMCDDPPKVDGSLCEGGTCQRGSCELDRGGGGGGAAMGGSGGEGGSGGHGGSGGSGGAGGKGGAGSTDPDDGCSCRSAGPSGEGTSSVAWLVFFAVAARCSVRRRPPWSSGTTFSRRAGQETARSARLLLPCAARLSASDSSPNRAAR